MRAMPFGQLRCALLCVSTSGASRTSIWIVWNLCSGLRILKLDVTKNVFLGRFANSILIIYIYLSSPRRALEFDVKSRSINIFGAPNLVGVVHEMPFS